jgi:hypothetical protein
MYAEDVGVNLLTKCLSIAKTKVRIAPESRLEVIKVHDVQLH